MILEKDKKIVAAVFTSRGKLSGRAERGDNVLKCLSNTVVRHNNGSYASGSRRVSNEFWEIICTIEEYNQCIEDMARAEWVDCKAGEAWSYCAHKMHCGAQRIDTSNNKLLVENCDYSFYGKPLVYTQGDSVELYVEEHDLWYAGEYITRFKGMLIAKVSDHVENGEGYVDEYDSIHVRPIKTPEQIKQDKLYDQVIDLVETFQEEYQYGNGLADLIELMQSNGHIVDPK